MTKEKQITLIVDTFKVYPKAPEGSTEGSYYDYLFKCGLYYLSKEDVVKILNGGRVTGTGIFFLMDNIRPIYPQSYKELRELI